jgi:hypothetical protein
MRGAGLLWIVCSVGCLAASVNPASPDASPSSRMGTEPMPTPGPVPVIPTTIPNDMGGAAVVRIAAGASAPYTDPAGHVWDADHGASGGTVTTNAPPVAVAGTDAPALYNSERYAAQAFTYTLALPDGAYRVELGFAETYLQASGQRRFAIAIDGKSVASELDIFDAAGGANRAVVESYDVTVAGGQIQIAFVPGSVQNPKVNSIAIVAR